MLVLVEDTSQTRGLLTKFCNLVITGLIFSEMLKPMYPIVMNANEWVSDDADLQPSGRDPLRIVSNLP
jgi:hypothetical protein